MNKRIKKKMDKKQYFKDMENNEYSIWNNINKKEQKLKMQNRLKKTLYGIYMIFKSLDEDTKRNLLMSIGDPNYKLPDEDIESGVIDNISFYRGSEESWTEE